MLAGASSQPLSSRDVAHAAALLSSGRFDEAEARLRALNEQFPEQPEVVSRLGHLALLGNRLSEAVDFLARALHLNPRSGSTWSLLADAYYRNGELGSAAYCYDRLGRSALASTLAVMAGLIPYRIQGGRLPISLPWSASTPLPVVTARINGHTANLVLDTGAGDLVVDEHFAIASGIRLGGRERRRFAGGQAAAVWYGHTQELGLDGLELADLPTQVLTLGPIFAPFFGSFPVHGILGTAVLSRFVVTLDYRKQLLKLESPHDTPQPSSRAGRVAATPGTPFWIAGDHYPVTCGSLPGTLEGLAFIDTGMTGAAFALPRSTAEAAGLSDSPGETQIGYGGGGEVQGKPVRLKKLCLGKTCRSDLHGIVLETFPLEMQFGFRIACLLAHDFFADCALILNFATMRLWLECASG